MDNTSAPPGDIEQPDVDEPLPTSWDELDADQRETMQHFLDTNPVGKQMYRLANYDRNFAVWLTAVYAEHWSAVVRPLEGLDEPKWRMRFDSSWTPQKAVEVETAPYAVITQQQLKCPHCGELDRIVEIARAEKVHDLVVDENGELSASNEPVNFHHLFARCAACVRPVTLPGEVSHT